MPKTDLYTPIKHYKFEQFHPTDFNFSGDDAILGLHSMIETIWAKVADIHDKVVVDAVIEYASTHGFSHLYLIDEKFVLDALKEKLIRDGYIGGDCNDVTQGTGDT